MPCGSLVGPITDLYGQDHAPANLSARQAREKGLLTSGIYGLLGITSSGSASLQSSLESRLKARFDMDGSILFKMTWKDLATPSGRSVCLLRASGRRTSDKEYGSWPTPRANENVQTNLEEIAQTGSSWQGQGRGATVATMAKLSSWPTPRANDSEKRGAVANDPRNGLVSKAALTGWLSPRARVGGSRFERGDIRNLEDQVKLATWPTPAARDYKDGSEQNVPINALLGRTAWLCSFLAPTANTGQLNPRLSGWLMGYPIAWDLCAMRIPERHSSTRSSKKEKRPSE